MRRVTALLGAMVTLTTCALPVDAQWVSARVARQIAHQDLDVVTIALGRGAVGPIGVDLTASRMNLAGAPEGALWGGGLEFNILRSGVARPYLIAGGELGFGTGDGPDLWASWSGGLGWELLRGGPFGLAAEGRYRQMSDGYGAGLDIGLRLSIGPSRARRTTTGPTTDNPPEGGSVPLAAVDHSRLARDAPSETVAAVVETALDAMGAPYRWGGTADDGFDCSGLIQYAYAQHGITLPRQSVDQARTGEAVPKDLRSLLPGDILTFATEGGGGGRVSHVGLYVGQGRFIHSAGTGVQISLLSDRDPYGAWWYRRWVGARRP